MQIRQASMKVVEAKFL